MTLSKLSDGTLLDVSKVIRVKPSRCNKQAVVVTWDSGAVFYYNFDSEEAAEKFVEEIYELSLTASNNK